MDNFTKNILAGIRQWFHKNQDDTSVVLSAHVNELYSLCSALKEQIAENKSSADTKLSSIDDSLSAINGNLSIINEELLKKLVTQTLTQEEYDALTTKSPTTLYVISNPELLNCYAGTVPIFSHTPYDALYFESVDDSSTIRIRPNSTSVTVSFEYSINGYIWNPYVLDTILTVPCGHRVYFRGNSYITSSLVYFSMTGKFKGHGSLRHFGKLSKDAYNSPFGGLFKDCTSLLTAPDLPDIKMGVGACSGMFSGCTSLIKAPALPSKDLSTNSYANMFKNCTSLVVAPVLPATELHVDSYYHMFSGCTSLSYIKCLATDLSANDCLSDWLSGVSSLGTFVKAKGVEYPTGPSGIPEGWTVEEVEPESSNENAE